MQADADRTVPTNRQRAEHYRAVFISDVHLGYSGCRADYLLDFLRSTTCDRLYLVGDIIDIWQMKKRIFWPQQHNDVIRTILGKAKHGTRIIYVPGNHDELLRDYDGIKFGNLEIQERCIHETKCGKQMLVIHGDQFDGVIKFSRTLKLIGSWIYDLLLEANTLINFIRRKLGLSYWSLARVLKHRVKQAVTYTSNFETILANEAKKRKVQGIIAGHIHRAEIAKINGLLYCNCGDWVESCTALVERNDGWLELIHWTEQQASVKTYSLAAA